MIHSEALITQSRDHIMINTLILLSAILFYAKLHSSIFTYTNEKRKHNAAQLLQHSGALAALHHVVALRVSVATS